MDKETLEEKTIVGRIASPGFVQGYAYVVSGECKKNKPEGGYILVSRYATPERAPLAFGAVGIVTDIGGIMCHLANVAREINIPCVVATDRATQIFRDGDLISLDARGGLNEEGRVYIKK